MSQKTFVSGGGDFRPPPYTFESITSITLTVKDAACKGALDALCEKFLNEPLQRTTQKFIALDDEVMFTVSRFPEAESKPYPAVGYMAYQEVCIAFRVFDQKNNRGGLYVPLLFLDGPQGGGAEFFATPPILVGRELFGLPKIRGEIDLNENLTGTVRCVVPTNENVIMALDVVLAINTPAQLIMNEILQELGEVDALPGAERKKRKTQTRKNRLLERRQELAGQLRERQRRPAFGKRLHPFQAVDRLWGANIANVVNGGRVDKRIHAALDAAAREGGDFDPARWSEAVGVAMQTGFFQALCMTSSSLCYPLVALRQIHNPVDFTKADHQDVIIAPFHYVNLPLAVEEEHVLSILSPELRQMLGLKQQYVIPSVAKLGFGIDDDATYGEPTESNVLIN